jgi:hypothetical protein
MNGNPVMCERQACETCAQEMCCGSSYDLCMASVAAKRQELYAKVQTSCFLFKNIWHKGLCTQTITDTRAGEARSVQTWRMWILMLWVSPDSMVQKLMGFWSRCFQMKTEPVRCKKACHRPTSTSTSKDEVASLKRMLDFGIALWRCLPTVHRCRRILHPRPQSYMTAHRWRSSSSSYSISFSL